MDGALDRGHRRPFRLVRTGEDPLHDELLTIADVARRLKIGRTTAYRMCAAGQLPVVRLEPAVIRVSAKGLDKWIAERTTAATS